MGYYGYKQKGFTEERIFKKSMEHHAKIMCEKSPDEDDFHKHIDFYLDNGWAVDVKSSNKVFNGEHHIWVELVNVNGNRGWIDGEATHIAFSLGDCYIFFERKKLRSFIRAKVKVGHWEYKTSVIKTYRIYTRRGKQDKIVLIPLRDILHLPHQRMKRDETLIR